MPPGSTADLGGPGLLPVLAVPVAAQGQAPELEGITLQVSLAVTQPVALSPQPVHVWESPSPNRARNDIKPISQASCGKQFLPARFFGLPRQRRHGGFQTGTPVFFTRRVICRQEGFQLGWFRAAYDGRF